MAELAGLLDRWRSDLASWAIPEHIVAAADDSPWVLPHQVFARRADRLRAAPIGPSFQRARSALEPAGSLLDVGAGAGAACLPLLDWVTELTAVDSDEQMLALLAERAGRPGLPVHCVPGSWPQAAAQISVADVVTCHHVVYNVPDVGAFLDALASHARRLVIVEMTATHPLTSLNELWLEFHGLGRPDGPTAAHLLAILAAMGYRADHKLWSRPGGADYASFNELIDVTRRRLCLPVDRAPEVAAALQEAGIDPAHPVDLGSSGRQVMTIWWEGTG